MNLRILTEDGIKEVYCDSFSMDSKSLKCYQDTFCGDRVHIKICEIFNVISILRNDVRR